MTNTKIKDCIVVERTVTLKFVPITPKDVKIGHLLAFHGGRLVVEYRGSIGEYPGELPVKFVGLVLISNKGARRHRVGELCEFAYGCFQRLDNLLQQIHT